MALIITPSSPPTPTTAQLQTNVTRDIKNTCTQLFNFNVANFTKVYNLVWANPNGLTPTQVCAALGTDAGALFSLAGSLQAVINAAHPGALPQVPPVTVTVNTDGSVTLGS